MTMPIYWYRRYFTRDLDDYPTVDEALRRARSDQDSGHAYPVRIDDDDGAVIYTTEQLSAMYRSGEPQKRVAS